MLKMLILTPLMVKQKLVLISSLKQNDNAKWKQRAHSKLCGIQKLTTKNVVERFCAEELRALILKDYKTEIIMKKKEIYEARAMIEMNDGFDDND